MLFVLEEIQLKGFGKCPKCGKEVEVNINEVLTSIPPQYNLDCPTCGRQYIMCKNVTFKSNS